MALQQHKKDSWLGMLDLKMRYCDFARDLLTVGKKCQENNGKSEGHMQYSMILQKPSKDKSTGSQRVIK